MRRLKDELIDLIRLDGPMPVSRYMALCLGHPTLGYYTTRDPFGAEGDFTTAPEISQMFGELLGLWSAQVRLDMGAPACCGLVEIGPGRGTLMADALRAIGRALPAMREAVDVRMVETSPVLRAAQQARLAGSGVAAQWHGQAADALRGPVIVIANELLDALPIEQHVATPQGWARRVVGLDAVGQLAFGVQEPAEPKPTGQNSGRVLERCLAAEDLVGAVAAHIAREGGAALFIDYGEEDAGGAGFGDTLQAMRRHAFVDPLAEPGEADLTAQVRFGRLMAQARAAGACVHPLIGQGEFLARIGLVQRAATLKRSATAAQAAAVDAAAERLTAMDGRGMGRLFKAMAFSHPALPHLPGFAPAAFDSGEADGQ